jgi:hypothetical protein
MKEWLAFTSGFFKEQSSILCSIVPSTPQGVLASVVRENKNVPRQIKEIESLDVIVFMISSLEEENSLRYSLPLIAHLFTKQRSIVKIP